MNHGSQTDGRKPQGNAAALLDLTSTTAPRAGDGARLSSALPSLSTAIEELKYPEVLFNLVKVGPTRPVICLKFVGKVPATTADLVREFTALSSLETFSRTSKWGGDKMTSIYIYDPA